MEGVQGEEEIQSMWEQFEKSLANPFQYDRFIEMIRGQKDKRKQEIEAYRLVLKDLEVEQQTNRSKSA